MGVIGFPHSYKREAEQSISLPPSWKTTEITTTITIATQSGSLIPIMQKISPMKATISLSQTC